MSSVAWMHPAAEAVNQAFARLPASQGSKTCQSKGLPCHFQFGMGQIQTTRGPQVLVLGSSDQGSMLGTYFHPQPFFLQLQVQTLNVLVKTTEENGVQPFIFQNF